MKKPISDVAFTPAVKASQQRLGSRRAYEKMEIRGGFNDRITPQLAEFVAHRDSLYLGTASSQGQPYIQHRGGPKGFLKVLDDKTLAFNEYPGNAQYISLGNLSENDQAFIFLMDYPARTRIKIWGTARFVEDDFDLLQKLTDPDQPRRAKRALVFDVHAWDLNCKQHITPRFTEPEIEVLVRDLKSRIAELESSNLALRKELAEPARTSPVLGQAASDGSGQREPLSSASGPG